MGFYSEGKPPGRFSRLGRLVPGPLRRSWAGAEETILITRAVFGLLLPVLGVMVTFIIALVALMWLLSLCSRS